MFGIPGGMEWVLIIIVVLLIFGGKKIPELMKGLGSGIKEFKKASNVEEDEQNKKNDEKKVENKPIE